ncbi:MAG: hypothetical protein AB9917_24600 [Negativicutes bacterium]
MKMLLEKQGKYGEGKNLAKSDKDIMQSAEKKLFEEFAIALTIPPTEVVGAESARAGSYYAGKNNMFWQGLCPRSSMFFM